MALSCSLSHALANLISSVSLESVGEEGEFSSRIVLRNFNNLNSKQTHNAGRLCAVARTSKPSAVSKSSGSDDKDKVGAKGDSKGEVEVIERITVQEQKPSASTPANEVRKGEDVNPEGEGKRRRRSRRTKAEIEADEKLKTVEDFFRALDAIGEGLDIDNLDLDVSPKPLNSSIVEPQFAVDVELSGTATRNGVVKPKAKRKPRAKKIVEAEEVLKEQSVDGSSPISHEDPEIAGAAQSRSDEDSVSVGNDAREQHEHSQAKDGKKSGKKSLGAQKTSSRKKRPGRRERGVLSQEVAEASNHETTDSALEGSSEAEVVNGTPVTSRLSIEDIDMTDRHGNSADEPSQKGKYVDILSDVNLNPRDLSSSLPLDSSTRSKEQTNERESLGSTHLSMEDVQKPTNVELHEDVAGAGSGTSSASVAEETTSDALEEGTLPQRNSGAKRRRQRKKKALPDKETGEAGEGQEELVHREQDLHEGLPLQEDDFDPITWCKVYFRVEADLEPHQRLCVVGANPELGGWDLSLALPLLRAQHEGSQNLWENTIKVPQGTMLEYKYFVEAGGADEFSVDRKFGPECQYFIPLLEKQETSLELIRDLWIPDYPVKLHSLSWGSRWWEQIDNSDLFSETDSETSVDASVQKEESQFESSETGIHLKSEVVVEGRQEAGPGQAAVASEEEKVLSGNKGTDEWLKRKIRKKALPREEPWLIESMIMEQRNEFQRKKEEKVKEEAKIDSVEAVEVELKKELPPVQVEILINSPQCTMQRMAILEDGKLVELLLEPVNTRVQVGNVYLGVVRQLLPGMSGVFVDIGGFQLALLDITRNQYPYTYPNLCNPSGIQTSGSEPITFDSEGKAEEGVSEDDDEDFSSDDVDYMIDGDEEAQDDRVEDDGSAEDSGDEVDVDNDDILDDINLKEGVRGVSSHPVIRSDASGPGPITVNFGRKLKKWRKLEEGMQIIVQVKKEALGKKGPRLTAFPSLAGRFWVLVPRGRTVGVSRRITGPERRRLRGLAMELQPANFGLTVRTEALGHSREELERDLARLMETWKEILDLAASSAVAAEHETEGAVPVLLHRAMGQTLTIVRDFFNTKVHRMVIDSPQCFQEVTSYLQEVAPNLCDRVELYTGAQPIFDAYNLETEIDRFSNKRVNLPNGGYLILEETEALVSIDVNGGTGMLAQDISQGEAILEVNLAAARQIALEIRLRDIGGIIVVDFIDMDDQSHHRLVYDEMRKAIQRDRSTLNLSEISEFGLMEMTRKRATRPKQADLLDSSKWPQFLLRVDPVMADYLRARKRKRITQLSAALKVWLTLKVALEFSSSYFQVLEQTRGSHERRANGTGHNRANQQNQHQNQQNQGAVPASGVLSKRVWPSKRRRNFGNQVFNRESRESKDSS
ncbi:hypothetical protein AXG93_319s1070 [Marchantia polymorpha subsp. ruderalis]|uniref:CBM20 domain-containing protein n=1 Tax=Marchantia polymorpha subsp. ruderalis TaxID=1480154 RepID=A0A176W653_MARPO|nr:hypothetical protein AXG93_319s1070 [Marchantia polymorpha subsp. ruderalis]